MNSYFNISYSCSSFDGKPPISHKVREYLDTFLIDNLLKKEKIIIGGKWRIDLIMAFCQETNRYKSNYIFMPKTPITVREEGVKIYEILIPIKLIKESDNFYSKTIELMFEAITIFFTTIYKKVKVDLMNELWKTVDMNYLLTLPYPASLIEQKYLTDVVTTEGEVKSKIELGWSEIQRR